MDRIQFGNHSFSGILFQFCKSFPNKIILISSTTLSEMTLSHFAIQTQKQKSNLHNVLFENL